MQFQSKKQCPDEHWADFAVNLCNTGQKTLHLKGRAVPMRTATNCTQSSVALQESIHVPAFSGVEVMAESRDVLGDGVWLLEELRERDLPVLVAGAVVTQLTGGKTTCVPVCP